MDSCLFKNGYLQTCGEAHQICAESKTCALSRRYTDGGRDCIKDGKNDGGEHGEGGDLIERQSALRDKDGGGGDNETFDQVLNDAIDNFSKSVTNHDSIFTRKKKCGDATFSLHPISCRR
jgi:hypothetical protein